MGGLLYVIEFGGTGTNIGAQHILEYVSNKNEAALIFSLLTVILVAGRRASFSLKVTLFIPLDDHHGGAGSNSSSVFSSSCGDFPNADTFRCISSPTLAGTRLVVPDSGSSVAME